MNLGKSNNRSIHEFEGDERSSNKAGELKRIYEGTVVSIDDSTDGGRIRVRIDDFDKNVLDSNLPYAYPALPKFLHQYPKPEDKVRIVLGEKNKKNSTRFFLGTIISQPHFISNEENKRANSTSANRFFKPDVAPSKIPEANGVYPKMGDIALLGRNNNDIILCDDCSQIKIRTGKHVKDNPLKLNNLNPASITLTYESRPVPEIGELSSTVVLSDKIALVTHKSNLPDSRGKFSAAELTEEDRRKIFETGEPIPRGEILKKILNIMINAIKFHQHNNSKNFPATTYGINDINSPEFLELLDKLNNPNIRIN